MSPDEKLMNTMIICQCCKNGTNRNDAKIVEHDTEHTIGIAYHCQHCDYQVRYDSEPIYSEEE